MKERLRLDTASLMAETLCADFDRRQGVMSDGRFSLRTRAECRYLNALLYDAVRSLCRDEREARLFMRDIGERRGYAFSESELSESSYKEKKAEIRRQILVRLHLV